MTENQVQPFIFLDNGGEMGALMRRKDWSATPVGNPATWPQSLRTCINLILNSQFPMFVWWGPDLTTFYNDAYISVAGDKHPELLGKSGRVAWSEIWHDLSPLVDSVFGGKSTWSEDQVLYMDRHGYIEETYFTFSYSPILEESGTIGGLFCACIETTEKVLATRRILQSERNLRDIILQSPVAMSILKGPSFVVEIANERMWELWGRGAAELLHRPIFDGLPEARHQGLEELLHKVFTTGESFIANERAVQLPRAGTVETLYLNFAYEPFRDSTGLITGILAVGLDVTEQVVARRRVEESEARMRLAASSARLGMYDIDLARQTITHSPRLVEIFGFEPGVQWPYEKFTGAILKEDLPIRAAAYERLKETGGLLFEVRIQRPDGAIRWVRLNGQYSWDGSEPRSLVGTVLDITEERKAAELLEQKIEERTQKLQLANEQLKQFTYAASHDLQEPLRKISFFLDKLLVNIGSGLTEDDQRITGRIQHTTRRMQSLINDLLAYSNASLGTTGFEKIDLNTVVGDVLDDMEASIIEKKAVVDLRELPHVTGDPRQMRQLLHNLISNALKYHKAGETPRLTISSRIVRGSEVETYLPQERREETFHEVSISDNGIGFDPDDAERIFQLFQRLHGKAEYEGSGVGLAIVQKVVDNHNGFIWADSQAGEGATFRVLIPVEGSE
jgi:PAS domain S-box-containing protein